jgi:hypothetical protein
MTENQTSEGLSAGQLIEDYKEMIKADMGHLYKALENGQRVHAHQYVDAIIDNAQLIEDTIIDG